LVWLAEAFEDSDFDEQVADSSAGFSSRRFRAAGKCGAVSQQAFFAEAFLSYGISPPNKSRGRVKTLGLRKTSLTFDL
jgi:hypothetical protein